MADLRELMAEQATEMEREQTELERRNEQEKASNLAEVRSAWEKYLQEEIEMRETAKLVKVAAELLCRAEVPFDFDFIDFDIKFERRFFVLKERIEVPRIVGQGWLLRERRGGPIAMLEDTVHDYGTNTTFFGAVIGSDGDLRPIDVDVANGLKASRFDEHRCELAYNIGRTPIGSNLIIDEIDDTNTFLDSPQLASPRRLHDLYLEMARSAAPYIARLLVIHDINPDSVPTV